MLPLAWLGVNMKYSVEVDRTVCLACGSCYSIDSGHYESDDEGKARVKNGMTNGVSSGTFDDSLMDDAKSAGSACCVNAITVKEL